MKELNTIGTFLKDICGNINGDHDNIKFNSFSLKSSYVNFIVLRPNKLLVGASSNNKKIPTYEIRQFA